MKKIAIILALLLGVTGVALAEDAALENMKKDKTGTNPVNFQREARVYNEYQVLNTLGDGHQNISTLELRAPFLDGKWQYRLRLRGVSLQSDTNGDGDDNIDESGFGDLDMRFLTVPYMDTSKMQAMALGLEVFVGSASEDILGAGTTSLGPQVFYAWFFKRGMFAPGLQYKFSVYEDDGRSDTEQILIDLNFLVMAKDKLSWFFTDPQIVFDLENSKTLAIIDLEVGAMMNKFTDSKAFAGHSVYIRPSIGAGQDRSMDYSVEAGYKIVGF